MNVCFSLSLLIHNPFRSVERFSFPKVSVIKNELSDLRPVTAAMDCSESISCQRGVVAVSCERHKGVIGPAHDTLSDELEAVVIMGDFLLENVGVGD